MMQLFWRGILENSFKKWRQISISLVSPHLFSSFCLMFADWRTSRLQKQSLEQKILWILHIDHHVTGSAINLLIVSPLMFENNSPRIIYLKQKNCFLSLDIRINTISSLLKGSTGSINKFKGKRNKRRQYKLLHGCDSTMFLHSTTRKGLKYSTQKY